MVRGGGFRTATQTPDYQSQSKTEPQIILVGNALFGLPTQSVGDKGAT